MEVKGYYLPYGFMGWIGDRYILFATEQEYLEIVNERD